MDATGDRGKATAPKRAEEAIPGPHLASDHPFGPDGAAILATEHWSLLASRSLIVVLVVRAADAATTVTVVAGVVAFLVVWAALFLLQRRALDPLRRTTPRFPTPPDKGGIADAGQ